MLDLLIRDGQLIDGTGAPRRPGSLGVKNGRIVTIGKVDAPARRVIDAGGRVVAPGFVDVHTHYDAQVFWDGTLSPSPLHGVTTAIAGNCGFTLAPAFHEHDEVYLARMLAKVEGMPLTSLELGVPWGWSSTAELLDRIDGLPSINLGFMVGHSTVRRCVMGDDATERGATDDEIAAMSTVLDRALAAGGLGFSSSWGVAHLDGDGRPVPSRAADEREILALARVCRRHPGTSIEFVPAHVRGEPFDPRQSELLVAMSSAGRCPVNWNVLVVDSDADIDVAYRRLAVDAAAQQAGGRVVALTMPVSVPLQFSFLGTYGFEALPGWATVMALPVAERIAALADPEVRTGLAAGAERDPATRQVLADWGARVINGGGPGSARYLGQRIADVAADRGVDPFNALLDIACADELRTTFMTDVPAETRRDFETRVALWRDERIVIGASDAGAHVDMLANFNYATRMISAAVREHGVLELEEAIHLLTAVPARLYGLVDRGRLCVGAWADVLVIDPDCVGSEPVTTRYDLPGGSPRLYASATGIDQVIVGGVDVVREGEFTTERPGAVLRSGHDTQPSALMNGLRDPDAGSQGRGT